MTDRPIIFSGPMVCALIEGRKTMTRRILKPQPYKLEGYAGFWNAYGVPTGRIVTCDSDLLELHRKPKPGDLLWVRENWRAREKYDRKPNAGPCPGSLVVFEADKPHLDGLDAGRLRPSIHMPRWASRLTLRVTAVKIERLQDISETDAMAEGVPCTEIGIKHPGELHRAQFADLWERLHGPDAWDANPWVAAISFEVIKANIDSLGSEKRRGAA